MTHETRFCQWLQQCRDDPRARRQVFWVMQRFSTSTVAALSGEELLGEALHRGPAATDGHAMRPDGWSHAALVPVRDRAVEHRGLGAGMMGR